MKIIAAVLSTFLFVAVGAGAAERVPTGSQPGQGAAAESVQKLDLNRATLEQLVDVPGIGQRTAEAILALRAKRGGFTRLEELLEVRGIKDKKLASISSHLSIGPRQPQPAPAAGAQQK